MKDWQTIERIVEELRTFLPGDSRELEKNLRAALTGVFDRLDLVTREELEVQEAVLARTRARLEALEKQLAALQAQLEKK